MAALSTALASTEESPAYSPRERSNTLRSFESSKTVVKATKIKEPTSQSRSEAHHTRITTNEARRQGQ